MPGRLCRDSPAPGRPMQRAEWVAQDVEAGGGVEACGAHELVGERLAEAAAEQAAHVLLGSAGPAPG